MSHPAITVENLSKAYRIGVQTKHADSLVGALQNAAAAPFRNWNSLRKLNTYGNHADAEDLHWALRDVSFEVPKGEVLGVIGRNGAGKSTLLKILSRITEPTRGRATIRGRVSSLLEVGTGFHPELSGRENIYLNGTILGMRKREIDRKLHEIIDFSGIEKFLDTPIKRYSSGMKVRLAFAVAAHLEPEILIIDEVLAVGDAEFQQKCLGKMESVAKGGRTVLFVSHSMPAVTRLCSTAICIEGGGIVDSGDVERVVGTYNDLAFPINCDLTSPNLRATVRVTDQSGSDMAVWNYGAGLVVDVEVDSKILLNRPAVDLAFYSESGVRVFAAQSDRLCLGALDSFTKTFSIRFEFSPVELTCKALTLDIGIRCDGQRDYLTWWQSAKRLAISHKGAPVHYVPNTIVNVPCQLAASVTDNE